MEWLSLLTTNRLCRIERNNSFVDRLEFIKKCKTVIVKIQSILEVTSKIGRMRDFYKIHTNNKKFSLRKRWRYDETKVGQNTKKFWYCIICGEQLALKGKGYRDIHPYVFSALTVVIPFVSRNFWQFIAAFQINKIWLSKRSYYGYSVVL